MKWREASPPMLDGRGEPSRGHQSRAEARRKTTPSPARPVTTRAQSAVPRSVWKGT